MVEKYCKENVWTIVGVSVGVTAGITVGIFFLPVVLGAAAIGPIAAVITTGTSIAGGALLGNLGKLIGQKFDNAKNDDDRLVLIIEEIEKLE